MSPRHSISSWVALAASALTACSSAPPAPEPVKEPAVVARVKTTIVGTEGLLKYLQQHEKEVMTTLSKKMIGYALGRTVRGSDRGLVDAMARAAGNATLSDLATAIVTSRQFRNRVGSSQ